MFVKKYIKKLPIIKQYFEYRQFVYYVNTVIGEVQNEIKDLRNSMQQQEEVIQQLRSEVEQNKREYAEMNARVVKVKDKVKSIDSHLEANIKKNEWRWENNKDVLTSMRKENQYKYYSNLRPKDYKRELDTWYKLNMGKAINWENPQTFNEKIQWMKLYDSTEEKTRLSDKLLVREWVQEKIGEKYLIPLIGSWETVEDIDFSAFPKRFVIKTNHGCGYNIIVKDKKDFNEEEAKKKLKKWLTTNFAFASILELHYKGIKPMILAEEYLENADSDLYDYKVWCFNGKAEYIMFLAERKNGLKMAFFDREWNKMPFTYSYPMYEGKVEKPDNLKELIEISEKLAQGFAHVRVDFYRLNDGTYKFGEMTFTSASGGCIWEPPEYNLLLGEKIILPEKSKFEGVYL